MKVPVLIPKAFNFPLTYESGSNKTLKVGDIVEVPFGKKKEFGVVWDKIQETKKKIKIRNVERKIDSFKVKKT